MNRIHHGSRNEDFKNMIINVLNLGNLNPKYMNMLKEPKNMELFGQAFVSITADNDKNYEMFEQLGDLTINKFLVQYFYRRFPQLNCSNGVKIVARLRINHGSKQSLSKIADNYGFFPFISAQVEQFQDDPEYMKRRKDKYKFISTHKEDLLEDSFEAFFGVLEFILDRIRIGVGYAICYNILAEIFDKLHISLEYEDLYDDVTILKETFDQYRREIPDFGEVVYKSGEGSLIDNDRKLTRTQIHWVRYKPIQITRGMKGISKGREIEESFFLAEAEAFTLKEAEQAAAKIARNAMKQQGYTKKIPPEYTMFLICK